MPATVFRPHWWEIRDLYERRGVGTPEHSDWRIWRGPYPTGEVRPLLGTAEQWKNGVSYADYLAGRLSGAERCVAVTAGFESWTGYGLGEQVSGMIATAIWASRGMGAWSDWSDQQLSWTARSSWGAYSSNDTGPERWTSRGQWTQFSRRAWASPQAWISRGLAAMLDWSTVDAQTWDSRGMTSAESRPAGEVTWDSRGLSGSDSLPVGNLTWTGRGMWSQSST